MSFNYQRVLVTGAAGFIGFHLCQNLLARKINVFGIDNLNDYYDVNLKKARLAQLTQNPMFQFEQMDLVQREQLKSIFAPQPFDIVINLAAQAGVRYSLENPHAYIDSNVVGFVNLLECCRHYNTQHLVFASSSSVYGANTKMPFSVHDNVDHPVSLYAATKKANELMAHTYSHLYQLPCTGLRFFTVYGPWGRPDMAYFLFTRAIYAEKPINVFNNGEMQRDFTYIDDIIEGVMRVMGTLPEPNSGWSGDRPDPGTSYAPYRVYNIGNNQPVKLMSFIETIERHVGKTAKKNFMEMQPGDVPATYANIDDLTQATGFTPKTSLDKGIAKFMTWYREYYKVS